MREHFSIKREDSQTEPRHNGPLGRPALQVRDLRARSHKIPSAHFLHPDSTLESLIRRGGRDAVESQSLRVDRWLWCARFFKTRSIAAEAVKGGHVRVNGQRAKPARDVKVGDTLMIVHGDVEREVTVAGIPARRGPAPEASRCYVETEASIARRAEAEQRRKLERELYRPPTAGRPDKRTRRLLRARRTGDD